MTVNCLNTSFFTGEFLTKNNMTVSPHPLYSPGLVSCDFSFFPQLKVLPVSHS
jgi:hypothetical protein